MNLFNEIKLESYNDHRVGDIVRIINFDESMFVISKIVQHTRLDGYPSVMILAKCVVCGPGLYCTVGSEYVVSNDMNTRNILKL